MRDVEQLKLSIGKQHVVVDLGCRKLFLTPDEARTFAGELDRMACELARREDIEQPPGPLRCIHFLHHGLPLCGFTREIPLNWPSGHRWVRVDDAEAGAHPLMCQVCLALACMTESTKRGVCALCCDSERMMWTIQCRKCGHWVCANHWLRHLSCCVACWPKYCDNDG